MTRCFEAGFSFTMSMVLTPDLVRAARVLLGWSQEDLCKQARIGLRSLTRFESGKESPSPKVREALYRALTAADIQFIAVNSETSELDGIGLRWRPKYPHQGIKVL